MSFIPHTQADMQTMLKALGETHIHALFDEIPSQFFYDGGEDIPSGISEMALNAKLREYMAGNTSAQCFMGAGAYEHHIPALIWDMVSRGEWMTAYTPYQAEASQGTLQMLYEFQSMMCALTGMDVSNASLYDGASALHEAVLMAARAFRKKDHIHVWVPAHLHPRYQAVLHTLAPKAITYHALPIDPDTGALHLAQCTSMQAEVDVLIIPFPSFFGTLSDVDALTDWAHGKGALVIGCVNPIACALLTPPGHWGEKGADIVCGEGQPLGIPMSFGGPYLGFLSAKTALVRQMPGRIVGKTVDSEGNTGFCLTLQAREQHIRRAKATSNICTNQGLLVTAATLYLATLGPEGLKRVAAASHHHMTFLEKQLAAQGIFPVFQAPCFHEKVFRLPVRAQLVIDHMLEHGYLSGYPLSQGYAEHDNDILICVTETKTQSDMLGFVDALRQAVVAVGATEKEATC